MSLNKKLRVAAMALSLATTAATGAPAWAAFPDKPIKFVVGFAPGGGTDILARLVAKPLGDRLGQPVVVDNRPGASGGLANTLVKNAEPDGYTLLIGASGAMTINPAVYERLPYDSVRDYAPITVLGTYPIVFSARLDLPIKTTQQLIDYAKQKPNGLNYGAAGVLFQLTTELFNQQAGIQMTYIPYKGSGPATQAIMTGEIDLLVADIAPALPLIEGKRVQPIAITSAQRSTLLPDVPTVAESGLPGFEVDVFVGLFAPAGTPPEIVRRLHKEIAEVLKQPEVREQVAQRGMLPGGMSPDETGTMVKREIERYSAAARAAKIKLEQ
jgi:tripartite-type tricarboxylate transporter receptor subunit TctC